MFEGFEMVFSDQNVKSGKNGSPAQSLLSASDSPLNNWYSSNLSSFLIILDIRRMGEMWSAHKNSLISAVGNKRED